MRGIEIGSSSSTLALGASALVADLRREGVRGRHVARGLVGRAAHGGRHVGDVRHLRGEHRADGGFGVVTFHRRRVQALGREGGDRTIRHCLLSELTKKRSFCHMRQA